MPNRQLITSMNHQITTENYLTDMTAQNLILFRGEHTLQPGTEHLASNEFDWYQSNFSIVKTDAVIGFGTNALWDLAVINSAKSMVIADWSPWPLIAHAFILNPLIRISKTAEEFIFRVSGLPGPESAGLTLQKAFLIAKNFTLSPLSVQKFKVLELLEELAANPNLSNLELKCLITFLRPRLGDNLNPKNGYGPFYDLKSPNSANLTYYLEQRYNPEHIGNAPSALSSIQNYQYLQSLFLSGQVKYALTDIRDLDFYAAVLKHQLFQDCHHFSISFSNIFDCGYYNGLTAENLNELNTQLKVSFRGKQTFLYRTIGRKHPHSYIREALT